MGEYYREPDNQIQADLALHCLKLLAQYSQLTATMPAEGSYEATLGLCVLQSLLTNCSELMAGMQDHQKEFFNGLVSDSPGRWGLTTRFIRQDTFPGSPTLRRVLTHMRNAVSHPTAAEGRNNVPSTGYTTLPDGSGCIAAFRFTDSPWVKRGERSWAADMYFTVKRVTARVRQFEREYDAKGYIDVMAQPDGSFELGRDGQLYWPMFVIELPLLTMIDLAKEIANHLAQPTRDHWDGRSIVRLVA